MRHRSSHRRWLGCGLIMASSLLHALPEDRKQPINLQADQATFSQLTGESEYQGNFELTQGSMRLSADVAKVFVKAGAFDRMEASGKPTRFSYRPVAGRPPITGTGSKLEYNAAEATVVVTGNAHLVQGGDEFRGQRIVYDLAKDTVNASGGKNGRINITLQPGTLER